MSVVQFRQATMDDVRFIHPRLRGADRIELEINSPGSDIAWVLEHSLAISDPALALEINGELACLCGVVPETSFIGRVWFSGTEVIDRNSLVFTRHSRRLWSELTQRYTLIHNYLCIDNQHHLRWAKWLGLVFSHGLIEAGGHRFKHFYHYKCQSQQSH